MLNKTGYFDALKLFNANPRLNNNFFISKKSGRVYCHSLQRGVTRLFILSSFFDNPPIWGTIHSVSFAELVVSKNRGCIGN